ncbi:MAG: phosphatase PAP2 family protein [Saprospiraceae bacterium]|nr:phosphatase PAP2 family protein [Saprospiraceae bacterium]
MIRRALFHFFILLILIIPTAQLKAQFTYPYQLDATKESIIFGASISLLTFAELKYKKVQPLSYEELSQLNRDDIWAIDRPATFNRSLKAKKWSDGLLYSSLAPPLSVVLTGPTDGIGRSSVLLLETILVNTAVTNFTKVLVRRKRPYLYNEFTEAKKKLSKKSRMSFFSGHTSSVTAMYVLSAKLFEDYNPGSPYRSTVWTTALLIPATTGLLRVKAGKHYFTDVLTGFLVGGAIGFLIPEIHKL